MNSIKFFKICRLIVRTPLFWGISSAGSEHLPYKQGVVGSNPTLPTKLRNQQLNVLFSLTSVCNDK